MKCVWTVAFEYRHKGHYMPWECWDERQFATRREARAFAVKMRARKLMRDRRLRQIHYMRRWQ